MQIKAMTYNIHHGKGTDGKLDLDRIIEVIRASGADIVGLNEVDCHFSKRSAYLDQSLYIAKKLQMHHAFGASFTLKYTRKKGKVDKGEYGNAILSRYPIISKQNHLFDFYAGLIEGRGLLETTVQLKPGYQLKIFVTHLSLNPLLHKKQTDYIHGLVADEQLPLIMLGDWNMRPTARAWNKLTQQLIDVCADTKETESFLTYPSYRPTIQLDYIFVSHDFEVCSVMAYQVDPIASDHLPLVAKLCME